MTITTNSAWLEAASRKQPEPVFLLSITDGVTTWTAQSGPHATMTYPVGIDAVGDLAPEINVLTRRLEIGEIEVTATDAWLRPIFVSNRLFGKKATLKIGFYDLAEGSFLNYQIGAIDSVKPDGAGRFIKLQVMSALEIARKQKIVGYWINRHPLDVIYDILKNKVGLDASLIDGDGTGGTAFDPDAAAYSAISHFVVSRYITHAVTEPTEAFALIDELAELLRGTLYVKENGKISFRLYDATAATVADWTSTDIVEFETVSLDEDAINHVEVGVGTLAYGGAVLTDYAYKQDDATSQAALIYPGMTTRILSHAFQSQWLMGETNLNTFPQGLSISATETAGIALFGLHIWDFSGTRESYPSASQPANAQVSAARPLYMITETGEIIKATGSAPPIATADLYKTSVAPNDPSTGVPGTLLTLPQRWLLSGVTRGYGGTTAAAARLAVDITIPMYVASQILVRHPYGVPRVKVRTSLRQYALEPGDFVSVTRPEYLDFGFDGLTSSTKWEILSKEVNLGDEPGITFVLAQVVAPATSIAHGAVSSRLEGFMQSAVRSLMESEAVVQRHISSGLDVKPTSGLSVRVSAGTAVSGLVTAVLTSYKDITLAASSQSYIYFDLYSLGVHVVSQTVGDAAPTTPLTSILLAVVTTSATVVTSVLTDSAPTKPIDGVHIVAATVDAAQIKASAVQTTHIGAAVVGPTHVAHSPLVSGLFANSQFSIAKKG